jgi:hypothetical protein
MWVLRVWGVTLRQFLQFGAAKVNAIVRRVTPQTSKTRIFGFPGSGDGGGVVTGDSGDKQEEEKTMSEKPKREKPRRRPVPYAARARRPGAGIVSPRERPPAGASSWPKWTLLEADHQGQLEMFRARRLR